MIDNDSERKREVTANNTSPNAHESSNSLKDTRTKDNSGYDVDGYIDPVIKDVGSSTQGSQHISNVHMDGYLNSVETNPSCEQKREFSSGYLLPKTPDKEIDDDGYLEPTKDTRVRNASIF